MRICVPIKVRDVQEALKITNSVRKRGIAFVEIWLDTLPISEQEKILKNMAKPYIVKSSDPERLLWACKFRPSFIDVDFFTGKSLQKKIIQEAHRGGSKIIFSFHDFQKTPPLKKLFKIIRHGFASGADIVKVATMIRRYEENVILFELVKRFAKKRKTARRNIIAIGMGEKGKISRIGCPLLGSYLAYAAYGKKYKTALGQLTLSAY